MIKTAVVFLLMTVAATSSTDYCSKSLCKRGRTHIACNNDGKFGKACPADSKLIEFTDELKQLAVRSLNIYRDKIARGQIKGYKNASRMATLVWNDELAKLAEYNARRCIFALDECRNTDVFLYVGQNTGRLKNSTKASPEKAIETITKDWFNEYKNANMGFIEKFPDPRKISKLFTFFTQLVRDEAYAVGCAMVQFKKGKRHTTIYVCDYSLTNIVGYSIYETSPKTATGCKTGTNEEFPGLCSAKEIYNNKFYK